MPGTRTVSESASAVSDAGGQVVLGTETGHPDLEAATEEREAVLGIVLTVILLVICGLPLLAGYTARRL